MCEARYIAGLWIVFAILIALAIAALVAGCTLHVHIGGKYEMQDGKTMHSDTSGFTLPDWSTINESDLDETGQPITQ
jgi:hypothetical protein